MTFGRRLAQILFVSALALSAGSLHTAEPTPVELAEAYLELASLYLANGDTERAEELIELAIEEAPTELTIRYRSSNLLREIPSLRKEALKTSHALRELYLVEARLLISEGRFDDARSLIFKHLPSFDDANRRTATELLEQTRPRFWQRHLGRWQRLLVKGPWFDLVALTLIVLLFYLVLTGLRRLGQRRDLEEHRWWFQGFEDQTGLGLGAPILSALIEWGRRAPVSAGLLKLDQLTVDRRPTFGVMGERDSPVIALATGFEALPGLRTVKLGAIATAVSSIGLWFKKTRPSISGGAKLVGAKIIFQLTARRGDASVLYSVVDAPVDGPSEAIEKVTFIMYHMIAKDASEVEAETAFQLTRGLEQLRSYTETQEASALDEAYEIFKRIRHDHPRSEEAQLYEGVALDLREKHSDAEAIFADLAERSDSAIGEKARYNQAISQFRKYRPNELEKAINSLDRLITPALVEDLSHEPPKIAALIDSPIKALAVAAKANAIAHKPIFWRVLLAKDGLSDEQVRNQSQGEVEAWGEEVKKLTGALELLLSKKRVEKEWDEMTRQQLRWAMSNALGNYKLNFGGRFLPGSAPERRKILADAENHLDRCLELRPPTVESLTNAATVGVHLARTEDVDDLPDPLKKTREYCEQAIALNPSYEYAYYRLCQAWHLQEDGRRARGIIRRLGHWPKIPSFARLAKDLGLREDELGREENRSEDV